MTGGVSRSVPDSDEGDFLGWGCQEDCLLSSKIRQILQTATSQVFQAAAAPIHTGFAFMKQLEKLQTMP